MADNGASNNPSDQPQQAKGDMSLEKRLLLAFLLMIAVLFTMPYFYRPAQPPPTAPPAAEPIAAPEQPPVAAPAVAPVTPVPGEVAADVEETYIVDSDLYRIVLSNRGAVVRSWILKDYTDNAGELLELVNPYGTAKAGYPFSLRFHDREPTVDLNQALYVAKPSEDGLRIDFEFSDGALSSRKSFRFSEDSYLAEVSSEVVQNGAPVPHVLAWRGGFGDRTVRNHLASLRSLYFDLSNNKLVTKEAKAARDGPVSESGRFSFAGIEDSFFAAVFLPADGRPFELWTYNDAVPYVEGGEETPHAGAGAGGLARNEFSVFVGPKNLDILRSVNPRLEQLVDFGWFGFLAKPLFLTLNWLNDRYIQNFGWSIVVITVIINFLLLPLKYTSLRSMKKMQALQPQIAAINAKYKGISLRDPRKAEQNQEVMDLYRKHGVNPLGGCFPMLLQIPFFIAFFKVLTVSIELRGATWLWVNDLSQPEHLPIRILPILMIISQFIMQKMTPTTIADPMQQRIMLMMPLFLGFIFYGFSSGLVLYWLTGNIVGIGQQWVFNKTSPPIPVAPPPAPAKKKRGSRK